MVKTSPIFRQIITLVCCKKTGFIRCFTVERLFFFFIYSIHPQRSSCISVIWFDKWLGIDKLCWFSKWEHNITSRSTYIGRSNIGYVSQSIWCFNWKFDDFSDYWTIWNQTIDSLHLYSIDCKFMVLEIRRFCIFIIYFQLSSLLIILGPNVYYLYVAKILSGLSCGCVRIGTLNLSMDIASDRWFSENFVI